MSCTLSAGRVHSLGITEPFLVMRYGSDWVATRVEAILRRTFKLSPRKHLILSTTHMYSHALKQVTRFPISMWHWTGLEMKWPTYNEAVEVRKAYVFYLYVNVFAQGTTGSKCFSAVTMSFFLVCMGFLVQVVRTHFLLVYNPWETARHLCFITLDKLQVLPAARRPCAPRTLGSMLLDHQRFMEEGEGNLKKSQFYNNCIEYHFFSIPLSQVLVTLHYTCRFVHYTYTLMTLDLHTRLACDTRDFSEDLCPFPRSLS